LTEPKGRPAGIVPFHLSAILRRELIVNSAAAGVAIVFFTARDAEHGMQFFYIVRGV
jgi:hypothetical protein